MNEGTNSNLGIRFLSYFHPPMPTPQPSGLGRSARCTQQARPPRGGPTPRPSLRLPPFLSLCPCPGRPPRSGPFGILRAPVPPGRQHVLRRRPPPARSRAPPGRSSPRGGKGRGRARAGPARAALGLEVRKPRPTAPSGVCQCGTDPAPAPHVHGWGQPQRGPVCHKRGA